MVMWEYASERIEPSRSLIFGICSSLISGALIALARMSQGLKKTMIEVERKETEAEVKETEVAGAEPREAEVKETKEVEAESRVGVKQVKAGATEKEGNTSGDLAPETDASTVGGQEYSDTPPGAENTSARGVL